MTNKLQRTGLPLLKRHDKRFTQQLSIGCICFISVFFTEKSSFAQKINPSPTNSSVNYLKKSESLKKTAWIFAALGPVIAIATSIDHANKVKGRESI
jgi:hypothetical protein